MGQQNICEAPGQAGTQESFLGWRVQCCRGRENPGFPVLPCCAKKKGKPRLGEGMSQQRLGWEVLMFFLPSGRTSPSPGPVQWVTDEVPSVPTASHCGGSPGAGNRAVEEPGSQSSSCRCMGTGSYLEPLLACLAQQSEAAFPHMFSLFTILHHLAELCWNVTVLP